MAQGRSTWLKTLSSVAQAGTGTLTQSGGTVTLNHNLYVGQSSGSTGTYNISGSSVLNVGRDFVIGRESGTGSLNMTGGTITKTGGEKFIIGHNNATGYRGAKRRHDQREQRTLHRQLKMQVLEELTLSVAQGRSTWRTKSLWVGKAAQVF